MNISAKEKILSIYLKDHPTSASSVLNLSDVKSITAIIKKYPPSILINTLNLLPTSILSEVLLPLEDSELVDITKHLQVNLISTVLRGWVINGKNERVGTILSQLQPTLSRSLETLINYSEKTVGSLMNPTPFSVTPDITIKELLAILSKEKNRYSRYIYIINNERQLIGVIPFKEAFYANKDVLVSNIMTTDFFSFRSDLNLKTAMENSEWLKWDSIPITGSKKELLGVLRFDVLEKHFLPLKKNIEYNKELKNAGQAVSEVFQIGLNATLAAFNPTDKSR
jgi:magnesium transporter